MISISPVKPAFVMKAYGYNQPKSINTPQKYTKNNQPRPSPRICQDHVVPGSFGAEIRARDHQWAEDQQTKQVTEEIAAFKAVLAFSKPLWNKRERDSMHGNNSGSRFDRRQEP